jgi:hypothetical protein
MRKMVIILAKQNISLSIDTQTPTKKLCLISVMSAAHHNQFQL